MQTPRELREKVRFDRTERPQTVFSLLTAWLQPNYDFRVFIIRQREERARRGGQRPAFGVLHNFFHIQLVTARSWVWHMLETGQTTRGAVRESLKDKKLPNKHRPGLFENVDISESVGNKVRGG